MTAEWIAAGKVLATDPSQRVLCPVCQNASLVVRDINTEGTTFERLMSCPSCRARNVLLMNKRH